ncbi:MAG: orotate phosphoribosyltransferase [Alphaproteobacteria bacterium]
MLTHEKIWTAIDRLAKAFGYSPSGLAKQAGLDPTSFNKSKRISPDGKPRWPSTESIAKILAVTDSTMQEFISLIDDETDRRRQIVTMDKPEIAKTTAQILLDTESVLFNSREPFTLKSGRKSPVYIDCRRLISFPKERNFLMDAAAGLLSAEIGAENIDMVAGGETAGIPYGAFVAERLEKPMIYVRKEPKGYGRTAQIEGYLPESGKPRAVLIEDLQTDGGSKKIFVDAMRDAGLVVEHAFVVFHYGIFPRSLQNMEEMGLTLHALATWWDVLALAKEQKYFDKDTLAAVEAFLNDPENWEAAA